MPHTRPSQETRIAIVGAGIAGLNAALTLQDAGLACTIYEAANYIGGRMHSNTTTWADSRTTEWCGEFIDSDHYPILALIKRFGFAMINLNQPASQSSEPITAYPELEKRCKPHLRATNDSWRVDETYVKIKKTWM